MNMLKDIKILKVTPQYLQFQALKELNLSQLRENFGISRSHWNRCTSFQEPCLSKEKTYTIPFRLDHISGPVSMHDVTVLYEDMYCLVVFKPAFLLVHGDGQTSDTLQARVNAYLLTQGWPYSSQAIHRIDFEASGLVLFSKFPFFQPTFDHQVQDHTLEKQYLCIVEGHFESPSMTIDWPISRDRHNAKKMRVSPKGRSCLTKIEKLSSDQNTSRLLVTIKTGRKHQIRVHLSHLGHPIVNDPLYGKITDARGLLLQSNRLAFFSPDKKEKQIVFSIDDPRMH